MPPAKSPSLSPNLSPRLLAALVLVISLALIGGAFFFEYGLGLMPCELCLKQRIPYYVAMPLALAMALLPDRPGSFAALRGVGFGALVVIFLIGAGLGIYHSGVEWHFWAGPADCTGPLGANAGINDFLKSLQTTRVVRCDEAAWRFLGLSLAGWNVIASLGLSLLAGLGLARSGAGRAKTAAAA
ncbi:disulfide bond formation protein B [Chelatococcus sp. GCM10030263]|uniref:disulfide bond formation protein B n=1 Tax=Chelatococcus sp. GCM10030263 TaxID=3273387 RepID=UPI003613B98B